MTTHVTFSLRHWTYLAAKSHGFVKEWILVLCLTQQNYANFVPGSTFYRANPLSPDPPGNIKQRYECPCLLRLVQTMLLFGILWYYLYTTVYLKPCLLLAFINVVCKLHPSPQGTIINFPRLLDIIMFRILCKLFAARYETDLLMNCPITQLGLLCTVWMDYIQLGAFQAHTRNCF